MMPRYFFNVKDKSVFKDRLGVELPDLATAKVEALHHFGEVLQSYAGHFSDADVWQITVADKAGEDLVTFSFFMHAPAIVRTQSNAQGRKLTDA